MKATIQSTLVTLQEHGPQNSVQIAARMGYSQSSARRHLTDLKALGLVHISGWYRHLHGGGNGPMFTAGPGVDALFVKQPRKRPASARGARPVYVAKVHALGRLRQLYQPGVFNPFATLIAQVA